MEYEVCYVQIYDMNAKIRMMTTWQIQEWVRGNASRQCISMKEKRSSWWIWDFFCSPMRRGVETVGILEKNITICIYLLPIARWHNCKAGKRLEAHIAKGKTTQGVQLPRVHCSTTTDLYFYSIVGSVHQFCIRVD